MADRVPRPLAALLAASLLLGLAWALIVPPFQTPDEPAHFSYTQYLAERGKLPGDPARPIYSSEHIQAAIAAGSDQIPNQPLVKPEWSDRARDAWRALPPQARGDGGGPNTAAANPPAAYLWQAAAYGMAGGDVFDRIAAVRVASVLWLPVTVLGTWLLAGELLRRRRQAQACAAAVPALLPMATFASASAGPEGMLYALWALALWLGVRILHRGLTVGSAAAFGGVVALACVTKATSYALLPAFAFVLGTALWRGRRGQVPRLAAAAAPLAVVLGGWFVAARIMDRAAAAQVTAAASPSGTDWSRLGDYLWQFYLPRAPGMAPFEFRPSGFPLLQIWIKQTWAAFGWLEAKFPEDVYRVLAVVTVLVLACALVALWRARKLIDRAVPVFFALAGLALLAGLHWTDYRFQMDGNTFLQGRYLLPMLPVAALALPAALSLLPERRRGPVAGVALAALLTFHIAAIGLVVDRFYA